MKYLQSCKAVASSKSETPTEELSPMLPSSSTPLLARLGKGELACFLLILVLLLLLLLGRTVLTNL